MDSNRRRLLAGLGVALGAPPGALAQSKAPRIALVDTGESVTNMAERHPYWGSLLLELSRLGHVEGQGIVVERWSSGGVATTAGYKALAGKVVASRPRLIVVRGRSTLVHVAAQTKEIPIVTIGSIPAELRASHSRPGGNVTGIHNSFDAQELYGKQVEVLGNVLKPGARIAWFGPQALWESIVGEAARKGAASAGMDLRTIFIASPISKPTIRQAFAEMARAKVSGVLMAPATELFPYREIASELAVAQKLPSIGPARAWPESGALLSYGPDFEGMYRRAAHYVDRILKGSDPAAIPIEQPTKIELVINLETAKAVGVAIPQSMLVRADRVIE